MQKGTVDMKLKAEFQPLAFKKVIPASLSTPPKKYQNKVCFIYSNSTFLAFSRIYLLIQRPLQTLLTNHLVDTYRRCSTKFMYSSTLNPRRVLTKPSESVSNDNYDNVNSDYILYVNDIIGSYSNHQ
jgi:hypothetical protein